MEQRERLAETEEELELEGEPTPAGERNRYRKAYAVWTKARTVWRLPTAEEDGTPTWDGYIYFMSREDAQGALAWWCDGDAGQLAQDLAQLEAVPKPRPRNVVAGAAGSYIVYSFRR